MLENPAPINVSRPIVLISDGYAARKHDGLEESDSKPGEGIHTEAKRYPQKAKPTSIVDGTPNAGDLFGPRKQRSPYAPRQQLNADMRLKSGD